MAEDGIRESRGAGFWEGAYPTAQGWTGDDTEEDVHKMDELLPEQGMLLVYINWNTFIANAIV